MWKYLNAEPVQIKCKKDIFNCSVAIFTQVILEVLWWCVLRTLFFCFNKSIKYAFTSCSNHETWLYILLIILNSFEAFFFFPLWRGKGWKWTLLYLKIVLKRSDILCENIYFTLLYRSILSVCGGTGTLQIKTGPNSLLFSIFMYALVWLSSHSVSRGLPGWQADLYPAVLYPKFHSGVWVAPWSPRLQDCGTIWLHWPRTLNQEPYAGSPSMLKGLG